MENLDDASSWRSSCSTKYQETTKISNIGGYWLLSSRADLSYIANALRYDGLVYWHDYTSKSDAYGVRPVIEVPMSYLTN